MDYKKKLIVSSLMGDREIQFLNRGISVSFHLSNNKNKTIVSKWTAEEI